jgi:hypothetical protein
MRPEGPEVNGPGREAGIRMTWGGAPKARHRMPGGTLDVPALQASFPNVPESRGGKGAEVVRPRSYLQAPVKDTRRQGCVIPESESNTPRTHFDSIG